MKRTTPLVEYFVKALEQEGVEFTFGVHGSALTPLIDRITHESSIQPILVRHEEGGAFMADGYARFSGNLGVCWGTSGPGTTNLLTGLATSLTDAVPVLAIAGQVPTSNFYRGAFQESTSSGVDSVALLRSVSKFAELVGTPAQLPVLLKKALRHALTGRRGPTSLVIPKDCWGGSAPGDPPPVFSYRVGNRCFDSRMVGRAADLIRTAKAPMIVAGTGVSISGANKQLLDLAVHLGAAVVTTPKAKGCFPEDHPLSLGVLGLGGHPTARRYLTERADLILVVGSSLGQIETENFNPAFDRLPLIHADIDAYEIGKNFSVDVGLVGDAEVVLRELLTAAQSKPSSVLRSQRSARLVRFKAKVPRFIEPYTLEIDADPIYPQRAIRELRQALPRDAVVFWDSGAHNLWGVHYFSAYEPRTFTYSPNFGAMGYGICAAIGAQLALPDRVVVSVCGDGGFLMNGMEVSTAVNNNIPVIWVVMNNHSLGMVQQGDRIATGRESGAELPNVDLALIAQGLGASAYRARTADQFQAALRTAISRRRPAVIDLEIDAAQIPPIPVLRPTALSEVA